MILIPFPTQDELMSCQISSSAQQDTTAPKSADHAKLRALSIRHGYERAACFQNHKRRYKEFLEDRYHAHDPEYIEFRTSTGRQRESTVLDPLIPFPTSEDASAPQDLATSVDKETKLSLNEYDLQFGSESCAIRFGMTSEWEDLLISQAAEKALLWEYMQRKEKEVEAQKATDTSGPHAEHTGKLKSAMKKF